jgi:hypothetical protein
LAEWQRLRDCLGEVAGGVSLKIGAVPDRSAPDQPSRQLTTSLHSNISYRGCAADAVVSDVLVKKTGVQNDTNFRAGL